MPTVVPADIERMREQLFFDGDDGLRKHTRFWMLLLLAGVIASSGVVADSTATVIGAMIVAPLMTPILGIVLAIVVGDRANLARSLGLVILGALAVIAIGWLVGRLGQVPVLAETNSQVAGRISPRLIDLLAALATGAVGAFALVRSDISDTLPGVAIAISLVPPLAVVGLTLEAGAPDQAVGALLLFTTNVAAILATGVVVMTAHQVHRVGAVPAAIRRRTAAVVVAALVAVVMVPLAATTKAVSSTALNESGVYDVAEGWAEADGWHIVRVSTDDGTVVVRTAGPDGPPSTDALRDALDAEGLGDVDVRVELVPEEIVVLPGN